MLLLLPQLLILICFFFIPSLRALTQSLLLSDPFGNNVQFVWFDNFKALFANGEYQQSIVTTIWFTVAQNVIRSALPSCWPLPPTGWCGGVRSTGP